MPRSGSLRFRRGASLAHYPTLVQRTIHLNRSVRTELAANAIPRSVCMKVLPNKRIGPVLLKLQDYVTRLEGWAVRHSRSPNVAFDAESIAMRGAIPFTVKRSAHGRRRRSRFRTCWAGLRFCSLGLWRGRGLWCWLRRRFRRIASCVFSPLAKLIEDRLCHLQSFLAIRPSVNLR